MHEIHDIHDGGLWHFAVAPGEGESLSHYLGRYRRANALSVSALGRATGLGAAIARWEHFYHNPFPSDGELAALDAVVNVGVDALRRMLPPPRMGMRHAPIRLCALCYARAPWHRIAWQLRALRGCMDDRRSLLSECPRCKARFAIPSAWDDGTCARCYLPFVDMVAAQRAWDPDMEAAIERMSS